MLVPSQPPLPSHWLKVSPVPKKPPPVVVAPDVLPVVATGTAEDWLAVVLAASGVVVVEVDVVEPVVDAALCAVVCAALPAPVPLAWATAAAWLLLPSALGVCGGVLNGVTCVAAAEAPA